MAFRIFGVGFEVMDLGFRAPGWRSRATENLGLNETIQKLFVVSGFRVPQND